MAYFLPKFITVKSPVKRVEVDACDYYLSGLGVMLTLARGYRTKKLSLQYDGPGPQRGGGQGGQLAPGPKQVGAPNLRNIPKLNKAPSKSGRVQGINGCI